MIAQLAERFELQALLVGDAIKVTTRHEYYELFYLADGRLWSYGHVQPHGRVAGPPPLGWALNTLRRLDDEKREAEFPCFRAESNT